METEQQQPESLNATLPQGAIALASPENGQIQKLPSASNTNAEWQQTAKQVADTLGQLPDYLGSFYQQYKQPIVTALIILSVVVTLRVLLALIDAINDIPLLSPTFEIIGISYSAWFVFRYLIKSSTRQELFSEINSLKNQFFGN
ncbi:CAAD domain-containing protein [Aliinostoc sp. HNIBRCY26]|uniref:CAAD domain-containing protein n=1 Tax=Aliinostoc sp. HNIBRCY26 TaxID=3418997 RepID=UPI003D0844C6